MRLFILLSFAINLMGQAEACRCAPPTLERGLQEISEAEIVFEGYVLSVDYGPARACVPGEGAEYVAEDPIASFKVVKAFKGTADGAIVLARLSGAPSLVTTANCEIIPRGSTCSNASHSGVITTDPRELAGWNEEEEIEFDKRLCVEEGICVDSVTEVKNRYYSSYIALYRAEDGLVDGGACNIFSFSGPKKFAEFVLAEHRKQ